jgi:hypothetical protein
LPASFAELHGTYASPNHNHALPITDVHQHILWELPPWDVSNRICSPWSAKVFQSERAHRIIGRIVHQCGRLIWVEETRTMKAKYFQGAWSTAIEAMLQGLFRLKRAPLG